MKQPNIVFYFSDQQRADTLGCYGQPLAVTPTLDQLAAQGARFEHAFTCQPVCGPARACLQSGQYATQIGCHTNAISLPLDTRTLAHHFSGAGYDTAYIGKWHLASDRDDNHFETSPVPVERRGGYRHWMASDVLEFTSHGYDGYVFDGDGKRVDFVGYRADAINGFAVDYLRERPRDKPFFLFISQIEPHHQNDRGRFEGPDGSKERFADFTPPEDLAGKAGDWRENYPDYLGQCRSLDDNVGRLVEALKQQGVWDNTILIYTSDHGCHFNTRGLEYKRTCHDSSLHVPLVVHGPGIEPGTEITDLVSLIDLPPTMLDLAGIPTPQSYQGRSLKPLLMGQIPDDWLDSVFYQLSETSLGRGLRTARWKYAVEGAGDPWEQPYCEEYREAYLYDLQEDPHEAVNLVSDPNHAEIRAQLAARLKQWIEKAEGRGAQIVPAK